MLKDGTICVVILCDCHYYKRVKGPCRHIYCIVNKPPVAEHFGLENFLLYETNYGEDLEYTRKVDSFNMEVDRHGGGLLLRTTLRRNNELWLRIKYLVSNT